jgi:hypothetical protein
MDPATKRLGLIAAALGSGLLAVVGAWTVAGHHGGAVPVIAPPSGPMRVKPADPGGMQLSANEALLSQAPTDSGNDKLAPSPEQPNPQALRPPPKQEVPTPLPSSAPAPTPATTPAPTPASTPVRATKASVAAPAAKAEVAPSSGRVLVQLGALPTEQAAKDQWLLLQHRLPDLLRGREPVLSKAELSGHTWWRIRTGGFVDPAAAKSFCDKIRAKGEGCDVLKS